MEGQWLVRWGMHAVVYLGVGIPSLHLGMVYRGGGGGGSDMMCCMRKRMKQPFFKTATKRALTQREHVDKRNECFIAAFQWHVNYSHHANQCRYHGS